MLDDLRQSGSLRVLFPRGSGPSMQAVLLNTGGGITGGDTFSLDATVRTGARLRLTTQAAERAYAAQPGETGRVTTRLHVADGAQLDWLPQETILFEGCDLNRSLTVDLSGSARLLLVEPVVFGRAAMGETLRNATFADRIELRRGGDILFRDAMRFQGDITAHLARAHVADGAGALATVVYVAPDAATRLPQVRAVLPASAGASVIGDDLLVARLLAPDSFDLRRALIPVLTLLGDMPVPRCWMI